VNKNSSPNPNVKKKETTHNAFRIPNSFFSQLSEFTNGGFVLITINDEGNPSVYSEFDNSIIGLGIRKFALDYFKAMDDIKMTNVSFEEDDLSD